MSDSLQPHGLQHARFPCPSPSPAVCSDSHPLSRWCYLTISSSAALFSFCLQSFPASGSFPMSQLFASGSQRIGASASASVLHMNIQGWFPLGLTGLMSLQVKETLKSFLQHRNSNASFLWCSAFFLSFFFFQPSFREAMATHSSTLAWKIPWTEKPGSLQSLGSLRVGHNWATSLSLFTFMHWRRKWQPTPVFLPGESQGWGTWWTAVYVVTESRTQLKQLSSSSLLYGPTLTSIHDYWKNHCFDCTELCWHSDVFAF